MMKLQRRRMILSTSARNFQFLYAFSKYILQFSARWYDPVLVVLIIFSIPFFFASAASSLQAVVPGPVLVKLGYGPRFLAHTAALFRHALD